MKKINAVFEFENAITTASSTATIFTTAHIAHLSFILTVLRNSSRVNLVSPLPQLMSLIHPQQQNKLK